ncbi:MAG: peptidoglycan-binding protein [Candidatus Pacebacteria bacterium]|nr:peptidoglycan-binding protein [Candidatus Paceibacterota bacterium]
MKKYLSKGLGFLVLGSLFLGATAVSAAPNWNVAGSYDIVINYLGSDYTHNVSFTQDIVGDLDGTGTSGAYAWDMISGSVDGDDIEFEADYTATPDAVSPQTTMNIIGTIALDGSMSGTWDDNYNGGSRNGTWTAVAGTADPILPQTIAFDPVASQTYGDPDFTVSATGGASGNDVIFSTSSSACAIVSTTSTSATFDIQEAGDCEITANQAAGGLYAAANPQPLTVSIDQKTLTVTSGISVTSKVYDKTTTATLVFTSPVLDGIEGTDVVTLDTATPTGTYDNSNVGTGKDVTVTGLDLDGAASANYELEDPVVDGDITPRPITVTAVTDTKVYDGDDSSSGVPTVTSGTLAGGDSLDFTQSYDSKNIGTGKTLTPDGEVDDGNGGANYTVTPADDTTGVITARVLNVTPSALDKVYDALVNAVVSFMDDGVDDVEIVGTARFADKLVGMGKVVQILTFNKTGADAGNYSPVNVSGNLISAEISQATLTPVVTAVNKVYDGNTTASATCTVTPIGTDVVTCSVGAATWDTKDVGNNKTVTATGITIGGADAGNYVLSTTTETDEANITPKDLTVSFTADNKVYDGNATATIATRTATGMVGAETVVVSGGTATFSDKNFGISKTVTGTGFTLSDSNYSVGTINTTTANITKRTLDVTADGDDKVYDGTVSATVDFDDDRVSGDNLNITGTATFADKHVGNNKAVSVVGILVTGTDAVNYTANTTTNTTANITPRAITVTGAANTKVYNATTGAAALPTITVGAIQTGDSAVRSETYDDKNVGTGKTMIPAIVITDGNGGNNYTVTLQNSANGTITVAPVTVSFTADNKVYDGNASADILARTVTGNIAPDGVITATGGTAVFNNKNVGTGKAVTATGFTLSDSNYAVTVVTPTTANITAKSLSVTANASDKVYDANTVATVTFSDDRETGDVFTVTGVANFVDKNVGNNKTVNVIGIAISGTDAGNYTPNTTTVTDADITQRDITVSATALNKVEDGDNTATVTLTNDAIFGDVVTQTYTTADFDDANVGVGKTVTVSGIAIAGLDAGNYDLTSTDALTIADINARQSTSGSRTGGSSRNNVNQSANGQVLGAEKFNFTLNMKQGSVGNEVMELQKFLNANGFGTLVVDGKFGPMTRAAVVKFQLANGLVGDGVVGPMTRAVLNK